MNSARFDYLELKTNAARHWDGGVDPVGTWMTTGTSGARCATATSADACASAFAALASDPASGTRDAWILLHTRGDEVGAIRDADDFVRLYAPIDTAAEAAFVATRRYTVAVSCVGSVRGLPSGGWDVSATSTYCLGGQYAVMGLVIRVAPDGATTTTYGSTADGGWCAVPGRRPDGLRDARRDAPDAVGRWLARAAHLEAASVFAFTSLARELADLDAPASLVDAARCSAGDERRHARTCGLRDRTRERGRGLRARDLGRDGGPGPVRAGYAAGRGRDEGRRLRGPRGRPRRARSQRRAWVRSGYRGGPCVQGRADL